MRTLAVLMIATFLLNGCTIWVCCDDHDAKKTEQKKHS